MFGRVRCLRSSTYVSLYLRCLLVPRRTQPHATAIGHREESTTSCSGNSAECGQGSPASGAAGCFHPQSVAGECGQRISEVKSMLCGIRRERDGNPCAAVARDLDLSAQLPDQVVNQLPSEGAAVLRVEVGRQSHSIVTHSDADLTLSSLESNVGTAVSVPGESVLEHVGQQLGDDHPGGEGGFDRQRDFIRGDAHINALSGAGAVRALQLSCETLQIVTELDARQP